jgi:hypothetical protein
MRRQQGKEKERRKEKERKEQPENCQTSRSRFLNFGIVDILGKIILCMGADLCFVRCLFSRILTSTC